MKKLVQLQTDEKYETLGKLNSLLHLKCFLKLNFYYGEGLGMRQREMKNEKACSSTDS
jgi:hypothetical protein